MPSPSSRSRKQLFKKYFAALFIAVLVPLLVSGASGALFGYRDQRVIIDSLLRVEAAAAAKQIQSFLDGIVEHLRWTTQLASEADASQHRHIDALRLLRQVPAITEHVQIDTNGKELLRVSRLAVDVIGSGIDRSKDAAFVEANLNGLHFGPVYFRRQSEPYMHIAITGPRRKSDVSMADVNLKLIWDVISKIKIGEDGLAFVIDAQGRMIAHPDISQVLRGTDETAAATMRALQLATADSDGAVVTKNSKGKRVIAATAPVTGVNWTVFVEQPLAEAFAPIYSAVWRTGFLLLAGAVFAGSLSFFLARRMAGPIRLLGQGAEQIGAGNFAHRIELETGDELEELAGNFNQMAGELALSQERSERISRLKQFLAPQVAELVENAGEDTVLDSQRVEVVTIFCDLRNFTAFAWQAEPDEIMGVLGEYYAALGPIITRYEATQTSFLGDGLMMLLNAPVRCTDPAHRAVRMAIEMQTTVQALIVCWRERGHNIGFGVGLAKGPATVGRIGYESRMDYTAIGNVVNLASRLCSLATDGQILVDSAVATDVGVDVRLTALGSRSLKGFNEAISVYAIAQN